VHVRYYLAQELVEGAPLDRLDDHWYREDEIVDIARQVLAILVYLQSLSPMVIHRDIKPANLLRRGDGTIALVDFGAAHVHGSTAGATTIGTFGYMPVEQLAGIVDATTDCFALGATLVHLLTRQEPWRLAQSRATINASAALRAFLDKLIAPDPRERFASAKDALAALDRRDVVVAPRRKLPRAWVLGTAALAVAGGGGVFALVHSGHRGESVAVVKPSPAPEVSRLWVQMPAGVTAELDVDGREIATVSDAQEIPLAVGKHHVRLLNRSGYTCEKTVELQSGRDLLLECPTQPPSLRSNEPRLHVDKVVSWSFEKTALHDVLLLAAHTCGVNVVVPDGVDDKVTIQLKDVPCDQAIDALLGAEGLDYLLYPDANLVRVAPRRQLDHEAEERVLRTYHDDSLPAGHAVSLDFKNAPLRDVLRAAVAGSEEPINLVIPGGIDGKVTVHVARAPWQDVVQTVLAAHGLAYRYGDSGHLLRVMTRHELDLEH
jgi:hypothetical protein